MSIHSNNECVSLIRIIVFSISLIFTAVAIDASEVNLYHLKPGYHLWPAVSEEESFLVAHAQQSIADAMRLKSKIDNPAILDIDGMSSQKVRHLLNNLCSLPDCRYLEIGVWKGSTWIAALYNNNQNISEAVAIDNWSEFGGPKEEFNRNCRRFLANNYYKYFDLDSFSLYPQLLGSKPFNIYFYDGHHSEASQKKAFTYYNKVFGNVFIALVDDWNWEEVRRGTFQAFEELGYQIIFEYDLPYGLQTEFWNGQYIAVIRRPAS